MDFGALLGESYEYTKEGLVGKWGKWILLIIIGIIPIVNFILMGYVMEIYRGARSAPELGEYGTLFINGIKLFIIGLIYAIPLIIVYAIVFGASFAMLGTGSDSMSAAGVGTLMGGMLVIFVLAILIALIEVIAVVRFSRTDSFGEAFNISAILAHIGRIGWGGYIISLVVMMIVVGLVTFVLSIIPIIGWLLLIILVPAIQIFVSRYVTLLYDSAPAPA
jgi:hypothetical protein